MIRAGLLAIGLASPALAQGLPVFDEAQGFEVLGAVDDGVLIDNAGQAFYCEVEEGAGDRFLVLSLCLPILGPEAARAAQADVLSAAADEETFLAALDGLPDMAFVPAIEAAMRAFGCTVDFGAGEEMFVAEVARQMAAAAGHDRALSADAIDEIGEMAEDAADIMLEQGRIVVDDDTRTARLQGCE